MIRIEFTPVDHNGVRFTQVSLCADPDDTKDLEGVAAYIMAREAMNFLVGTSPVGIHVPGDASEEGEKHLRDEMVERVKVLADRLGVDLNTTGGTDVE